MKTLHQIGIDTSKDSLVCCLKSKKQKDKEFVVGNDEQGISELLAYPIDFARARVVIEATSRYHLPMVRALQEAGATVQVLNPRRSRALAVGLGILDKDDKVDAWVLARAAQLLEVKQTQLRNRVHEELRDLSRFIDTQTQANAQNKKRLGSLPATGRAAICLKATIKVLAQQIAQAKKDWLELLKKEPELKSRYELAISVQDVGKETARIVACEMPAKLEDFRSDQLCAYSGVVPRRSQSGNHKGKDQIGKGGNSHLRTGLFMASARSVFFSKANNSFYFKLIAKGRTHKQAMIAVVHRLLRQVVAVLKRGTPWTQEPPAGVRTAPI